MDGVRLAALHQIVSHAREGTPELSCCPVNGPRVLGTIHGWAVMRGVDGAAIADYYGPSEITLPLGEGVELELTQETVHPRKARVDLRVSPSRAAPFPLKLRVPYWASRAGTAERQGPGSIVATYTDSV